MYHRVARVCHDPWRLAVTPEHFAQQIEVLTQARRVVPLRHLEAQLREGRIRPGVAAVTFDDGCADLLTAAKPVLERFECPATIFLTTGAVGSAREFWWDELTRLVLEPPTLPGFLTIEIAGRTHRWQLDDAPRSPGEAHATSRLELYRSLWTLLRPLDQAVRLRSLDALAAWAGTDTVAPPESRPLTAAEVRRLVGGLTEIGAHSITHPSLPGLSRAGKHAEVLGSRRACEELVGRSIDTFAYPYGDLDLDTIAAVREAGFTLACATAPGGLTTRSDPLRLPRVAIDDLDGNVFARRLRAGFDTP